MKNLLIIAGSDPSGGAGIQADIKTATAHKIHSSCVITALTAQNTQKVSAIHIPPTDFLQKQLATLISDVKFKVAKVGMLANRETIEEIDDFFAKNPKIKLVLDPVMVATSGDLLLEKEALESLKKLARKAYLITPNIDEAQILSAKTIKTTADIKKAAQEIQKLGAKNVLIKAGHLNSAKITNILLDEKGNFYQITNKKIQNQEFHGTGCTLASAIASNLAKGFPLVKSTRKANKYIEKSLKNALKIGFGAKVLRHFS